MVLLSAGALTPLRPGPVEVSTVVQDAGHGGPDLWHAQAAYGALYRSQPMVYTLVRKLAVSTARIPLKTFTRDGDDGRAPARDSAIARLLRRPNPMMGPKRLWLWTASTRELYGEAIWLKARNEAGQVVALWPMHPSHVGTRRNRETGALEYSLLGGRLVVPARDVVHFASYNPDSTVRGLSACEPLRHTLEMEYRATRANAAMWKNGARPSVVLKHPKTLSEPAQARLRAMWDTAYAGVDNWGRAAILEEGVEADLLQLNAVEMQYVEGRRLGREECCGAWDVPPPVVHILDRATFSNITEQMRSMYRDTMAPRFDEYEDTLLQQLVPDFALLDGPDVYLEFVLDAVLRGDTESRVTANAQAIQTGQLTPNEARRRENLPDVEGGDQLFLNAALMPLPSGEDAADPTWQRVGLPALVDGGIVSEAWAAEQVGAPTAGLGTQPERHTDEPVVAGKSLSQADARLICGRLRRAGGWDGVDDNRLLAGVEGDTSTTIRGLLVAGRSRGTDLATVQRQILAQVDDLLALPAPKET